VLERKYGGLKVHLKGVVVLSLFLSVGVRHLCSYEVWEAGLLFTFTLDRSNHVKVCSLFLICKC
jgi:hypothetical protein